MTLPLPHFRQRNRLTNWATRLDPEANEITLGDNATVPAAQAPHHDDPAWILHLGGPRRREAAGGQRIYSTSLFAFVKWIKF
jgi:hypothetical protein